MEHAVCGTNFLKVSEFNDVGRKLQSLEEIRNKKES
jgi:hypothetical protein